MQTISKYFVALLLAFFSNYVNVSPTDSDMQAGIHETHIKLKKQSDCNKMKKSFSVFENYS
ncbi:MAG: hypothetical protein WBM91_06350 [Eudoraea sp.]|jgi:hypothetical protein|uniref:hypothetical protein n=1 Tax=Eudoraea sp. TaxID=1979955 RepID=UPI0035FF96AD